LTALQRLDSHLKLGACIDEVTDIKFGIGITLIIGIVEVVTPIGPVIFRIVAANTPFLLALADLKRLRVNIDVVNDALNPLDGKRVPCIY
jgi:hypothetical protein